MPRNPKSSGVVFLQRIDENKLNQAREFRKSPTSAEEKLWGYLRGNKIMGIKFRRQQIIEGFVVDFFCHPAKLVVEVDGDVHDSCERKIYDKHREQVFKARGLQEIRFRNEDVFDDIDNVIKCITNAVKFRAQALIPPLR